MPLKAGQLFEFGPFRLDARERRLTKDGLPVLVTPKAFDTLVCLVDNAGSLVTRQDLMARVWPDTFIEDVTLARNISDLRKALGEGYIATVPRHGYRFVAKVSQCAFPVADSPEPIQRKRLHVSLMVAAAALVPLVASALVLWKPSASHREIPSIAVLPFRPLSITNRDELIELGMADTLITTLSRLQGLMVRPTSAVRKYTDPTQDAVRVGRELQVQTVVDGTIQRLDDTLHVTVRLIRVKDEHVLWSGDFDRRDAGVFAAQESISRQVSAALIPLIQPEEARRIATRSPASPEAYELYAKGRYFWNKRTEDGFQKAIEYFEGAIAKDPSYAAAYGGLADSYVLVAGYRLASQHEIIPLARAAAKKALELDTSLGEAHRTLALIAQNYDLDWDRAASEYKLALQMSPGDATAHAWHGEFLGIRGHFEEGLRELAFAHQIDPLSQVIMTDMGKILYYAGRSEEAIAWCRKALELDPGFQRAHLQLSGIYESRGQPQAALEELLQGKDVNSPLAIARIRAAMGDRIAAERELERLSRNSAAPSSFFDLAIFYLRLGDRGRALDCMEQAYARRDVGVIAFKTDPFFAPLRDEPRFRKLLQVLKL